MSEQANHTPGPWSYWHDECASCEREGKKEFVISGPPGAQHGQFSHEPDARLIAAAPELLAVLQSLMPNTLIGESYDPPVPANEVLKEFLFTWGKLRAARAAIAKALGQDGSAS